MTNVRLEVGEEERGVLLWELDGFLDMTAALYRQIGREWDPQDASAPDVAVVARAREQLAGEGPWQIEGTTDELEFLLGRLRAAAELALQRGTQPSPARRTVAMNTSDAEGTDAQLDILGVADALIRQLHPPESD